MNQKIKDHVSKYNTSKGYGTSDAELIETIRDAKQIWKGEEDKHRWWTNWFAVVEIDGLKIGFEDASSDGDMSARERGWEFDPSTICEVEPETVTVTRYKIVKEVAAQP